MEQTACPRSIVSLWRVFDGTDQRRRKNCDTERFFISKFLPRTLGTPEAAHPRHLRHPSTTLSDLQPDVFELQHPLQVMRVRHEEMRGQDFLDNGTHARQRQSRLAATPAFVLEKTVGDRG